MGPLYEESKNRIITNFLTYPFLVSDQFAKMHIFLCLKILEKMTQTNVIVYVIWD